MNNNIITYKHRKICSLVNDGIYELEINKAKRYEKEGNEAMIIEFIVDAKSEGTLLLTEWFHDSSDLNAIKKRHQLFSAVCHPEWFDLEKFDVTLLNGIKLLGKIGHYFSKKDQKDANCIQEFIRKGQQTSLPTDGIVDSNLDMPF